MVLQRYLTMPLNFLILSMIPSLLPKILIQQNPIALTRNQPHSSLQRHRYDLTD